MKELGISPGVFVIAFLVGLSFCFAILSIIIALIGTRLPQLPYVIRQKFQEDSVYRWFLSSSPGGWTVAIISTMFQTFIAYVFLRAGDATFSQVRFNFNILNVNLTLPSV